jgi:hypothetical protein
MAYPVTLNGTTYTLADFEGTNYVDGLPNAFEDFVTHAGNTYQTTSTTSITLGTGTLVFTVADSGKPYSSGTPLRISNQADETDYIDALVTTYTGTTLTVNAVGYSGTGTIAAWNINIGGGPITVAGTLPVSQGGTGATTAAAAATALGLGTGDTPTFAGLNVTGTANFGDVNITNVGDIALDTISSDAGTSVTVNLGSDAGDDFIVGSNYLVVEGDTGRTGIGTASPSDTLEVSNASNYQLRLTSSGQNYQIGRSTSDGLLHFYGNQSGYTGYVFDGVDGESLRIKSNGQIYAGAESQSIARFGARKAGAAIEFGHSNNSSGYYGTLGAYGTAGIPYIGFSADAEDSVNTFTTRGFKGNLIIGGSDGSLSFSQLTNASATGQTPTPRMIIDPSGMVGIGSSNPLYLLSVRGSSSGQVLAHLLNSAGTSNGDVTNVVRVTGGDNTYWANLQIQAYSTDFMQNGTTKLEITSTGKVNTWNRPYGFINHNTTVSLADDATIVINAGTAGGGILAIYETASGQWAVFGVGYNGATIMSALNAANFDVIDTDGRICVIPSGHTITIKNRLGGTKGFYINMFMAGNNFAG